VKIRDSALQDLKKLIIPNEVILQAITNHVGLDSPEEARSIYREATKGNKVAQFIVGISLQKARRREVAEAWLTLSAKQGFEPAKLHLEKAS
jgi:hypothetical protein